MIERSLKSERALFETTQARADVNIERSPWENGATVRLIGILYD